MGEGEELRLGFLGGQAGGPGLGFSELVLKLIKDFFDVPAAAIQFHQDPWREIHFVGEKLEGFPRDGIEVRREAQVPWAELIIEWKNV